MADSMEMMAFSILAPALECEWSLNSWEKALITMVYYKKVKYLYKKYNLKIVFYGMMLSRTIWGKISDKYRRRVCLFLCTAFTFVFGFAASFSPSFIWILVFRALVGFGITCITCIGLSIFGFDFDITDMYLSIGVKFLSSIFKSRITCK
jgi:MFS family permease